jgi:polyisoprenyl-teichoic acid--peptidoglycan teichoic acid transferase
MHQPPAGPPFRGRALVRRPRPRRGPRLAAALLLLVCLVAATVVTGRALPGLVQLGNPLGEAARSIDPPAGSVPWKLQHGLRVNLLLLGYGGSENDAPYLTDTVMAVSLDPAGKRAVEASLPRDLVVRVDAWPDHRAVPHKLNEAYSIGRDDGSWPGKRPELTAARGGGGRLAEQTVAAVTGLSFDGYIGVDFKAFRDLVTAVGGVQVCLGGPLDDNEYPDSHGGYVRGGVHFREGCQQVNGEQALELARSRHAVQAEEASDFARARRQQLLLNAIRKKATSLDEITRAPQLLDALRKDMDTSLGVSDMKALSDWSKGVADGAIERVAITDADFLAGYYLQAGSCGSYTVYALCPQDGTFRMLKDYLAGVFVDPRVAKEGATVQVVNASRSLDELGDRVTRTLQPLGFKVAPAVRMAPAERSVVYDYSGGRYPLTARWLAARFGATVVQAEVATPATPSPPSGGLAVVLGHDYALRWIGQGT